jgi:hypothetical protein
LVTREKCVDGFIRGVTLREGGGIAAGYAWFWSNGTEGWWSKEEDGGKDAPPAAKTAGGIAWIRFSR